jgi:hypothetical protein
LHFNTPFHVWFLIFNFNLESENSSGSGALTALRVFRIMRVF